jgi:hypothetical protein
LTQSSIAASMLSSITSALKAVVQGAGGRLHWPCLRLPKNQGQERRQIQ